MENLIFYEKNTELTVNMTIIFVARFLEMYLCKILKININIFLII